MASINKLVTSLAHATSEVTFAAANLNLDFSIFKFEAPAAYKAFGDKLSLERKEKAEYGTLHTTARKLGALFNETLPKVPTLITAYGVRVSEILPLIDSGSEDIAITSLFGPQLGADGTTIWAAATSGDGAVPVHLLACLLARSWNGPQATSIWAQMVEERKKEISEGFEKGTSTHYPSLAAFRTEITRQQLAEWDASARAWIRAADEVKRKDLDKLRLVINNLDLPVDPGSDLYQNVTRVWHSSMSTIENLLNGIPQTVYNGAMLLGISSWHILPDMISFNPSGTEIKHNDPLIPTGGVLTLGLKYVPRDADISNQSLNDNDGHGPLGVFWSLPLAHLKFYGPPVRVSHSLGVNAARVSFDQFMIMALGSLSSYLHGSLADYANFFTVIWDLLEATATGRGAVDGGLGHSASSPRPGPFRDSSSTPVSAQDAEDKIAARSFLSQRGTNWIRIFHEASVAILESEGLDQEVAFMLANCGRRRGKQFWSSSNSLKFFGLCELGIIVPLLKDTQTQIELLRSVAQKSKLAAKKDSLLLIRYPAPKKWVSDSYSCFWEATTAMPFTSRTSKRSHSGTDILVSRHRRFIIIEINNLGLPRLQQEERLDGILSGYAPCTCPGECIDPPETPMLDRHAAERVCPCRKRGLQCTRACHFGSARQCTRSKKEFEFDVYLDDRLQKISALGEDGFVVCHTTFRKNRAGPRMEEEEEFYFSDSPNVPQIFHFIAGCPQEACLYGRMLGSVAGSNVHSAFNRSINHSAGQSDNSFERIEFSYDDFLQLLATRRICVSRLISFLDTRDTWHQQLHSTEHQARWGFQEDLHKSLRALAYAADIYRLLPSVSVAMSTILTRNIHEARWVPEWSSYVQSNVQQFRKAMTRAQTFACLAMFETGNLDLFPNTLESVMAMASGDSLFISSALLCDPAEVPNKHEITRALGNIGKAGLAMLIAPESPRSRDASLGDWSCISHNKFRDDHFNAFNRTSLHLSFTGYSAPLLSTNNHGVQDVEAYLLEAVLSVYNGGDWIGDLNVLKTLDSKNSFVRVDQFLDCGHDHSYEETYRYVAFDSWEEVLEGSEDIAVARAYQNWQARLALTCLAVQRGTKVYVLPNTVCWQCLHSGLQRNSRNDTDTGETLLIL